MLLESYGEHGIDKSRCFKWFKNLKVAILTENEDPG